jgi:cysteine desulfurase
MLAVMEAPTNASSIHAEGRDARVALEKGRAQVAALAGTLPGNVYFTSGATEANNWVLRGMVDRPIVTSAIEHPSVMNATAATRIRVTQDGVIDLNGLEDALKAAPSPVLVSVMLVNNETGVIQPTRAIADLAHRYGALVHGDGVQAAGRIPVSMAELGLDYMTLSAHKLGGPQGMGALVAAPSAPLEAWIYGGTQENRRRAGTQNVMGAVGFGAVADIAHRSQYCCADLRDDLESQLLQICPRLIVAGANASRTGNTSMIAVPGLPAETQIVSLDLDGIAVSSGAACSSGKVEPSPVLIAMGYDPETAKSAIRVSFGWTNTPADVAKFVASWQKMYLRFAERRAVS